MIDIFIYTRLGGWGVLYWKNMDGWMDGFFSKCMERGKKKGNAGVKYAAKFPPAHLCLPWDIVDDVDVLIYT